MLCVRYHQSINQSMSGVNQSGGSHKNLSPGGPGTEIKVYEGGSARSGMADRAP